MYLLDTNSISHLIRKHPKLTARIQRTDLMTLAVSSIVEAELRYGLARKPQATTLATAIEEFLYSVTILPWDSSAAQCYAQMRNEIEQQGKTLSDVDALIAAHAIATDAILVSSDKAFRKIPGLRLEDWTH